MSKINDCGLIEGKIIFLIIEFIIGFLIGDFIQFLVGDFLITQMTDAFSNSILMKNSWDSDPENSINNLRICIDLAFGLGTLGFIEFIVSIKDLFNSYF